MPLPDLAQAVPGLLVAVLLPGYALATLLAPRWRAWERLAGAPGLSAGFLGVLGLALRLVHIPFEPAIVLPCIAAIAAAAAVRRHRVRDDVPASGGTRNGAQRWIPTAALVAGSVGAAMFVLALHGQVLPPDWDSAAHGGLANTIARTHDVLPLTPVPLEVTSFARARPGFEAMAAVVSWVGGPSPAASMAPAITAVLVLLPLGLSMLALEATGSLALAALVPFFAIGLAFPSEQAILGRFPQVVDSTLVVPWIVALMRVIRGRQLVDSAALIAAITASIWVIHGLELLTALVVAGTLLLAVTITAARGSPVAALRGILAAGVGTAAGVVLVTLLTRVPKGAPPLHTEPSAVSLPVGGLPAHPHELLQFVAQTNLTSPIAVGLLCAGAIAIVVQRRMLWVLVAEILVVIAMFDTLYWHHFASLIRTVYPWGDTDRLLGIQYWIIPFILAAGVLGMVELMRALARDRRLIIGASLLAAAVAVIVVLGRHRLASAWTDVFGSPTVSLYPLGTFSALAHLGPWLAAIAAAVAAVLLAWLASVGRLRLPSWGGGRRHAVLNARADVAVVAVVVLALISVAVGARTDLQQYQRSIVTRGLVTPADETVLSRMSASLPPGALVLTDGNDDAGMWVAGLTDLTPLVPNGFEGGPLGTPMVIALANACEDPAAAMAALRSADAVFVGAHRLPAAQHPWKVDCIARLPGLRLIASAPWQGTEAAAFSVVH